MNIFKTFLLVSALAFGIQQVDAIIYSSGPLNQTISDGNLTGYSSTLNVISGVSEITDITVSLIISGGFNGDLYAYLTHDGQTAILLNRIGTSGAGTFGNSGSGMNVTFVTSGADNIHGAASGTLSGNYLPDGRYASPTDLAAINSAGTGHDISQFVGKNSSGTWTLFIADVDGGAVSTLNNWEMDITGVPEPANLALGIFATIFAISRGVGLYKGRNG